MYRQIYPLSTLDAGLCIILCLYYMNYRKLSSLFMLIAAVALPARAGENSIQNFGPESGPRLIFTTSAQENSSSIRQLAALEDELKRNPPATRVSIIITENDYSVLPHDIQTGYPEGTKKIVSLLLNEDSGAVILLNPGNSDSVRIRNGAQGKTSPRWILEQTVKSLDLKNILWNLEEYRMPLYRMGWIPEDERLGTYLRAEIPALILETDVTITPALLDIIRSFNTGKTLTSDSHYLVVRFNKHLFFVGEMLLVIIMIVASASILFFLFILSFLFGEKKDQHVRDLFHIWWLPLLYFGVNILCLFLGQSITTFFFNFRFGNAAAWTLMPQTALIGKLIISWFFITLIISFNQLIHFPEDPYMYGYIAGILCMINIFIFSSLDFSLSLLFLSAYGISFIAYHVRHPAGQVIGIICLAVPFYPYLAALYTGELQAISPLYTGSLYWNIRLALFVMPFQLLISRLLLTLGLFGRKKQFYLPLNLVAVFILMIGCTGVILFVPGWSTEKPLIVPIRETIDAQGHHISVNAPVKLQNLVLEPEDSHAFAPSLTKDPGSFIHIETSSRKFLDRQLVIIDIVPFIPVQKIELTITSDKGISVYDASFPFELREGARESFFTSGENPNIPFKVNFSSDIESVLTAKVRVWSRTNPYGLTIKNKDLTEDYILEVIRSVQIPVPLKRENKK